MLYSELKTTISELINRRDITATQIERYVKLSIDRLNRKLRADFMETEASLTVGASSDVTPPADYRGAISLYKDEFSPDRTYTYKSWRDFQAIDSTGSARCYTRRAGKFYIKPLLAAADTVTLFYFAATAYPTLDSDEPELFKVAPDLVCYGAAVHAAATYDDDRLGNFEQGFEKFLGEVIEDYQSTYMSEGPLSIEPSTDTEY